MFVVFTPLCLYLAYDVFARNELVSRLFGFICINEPRILKGNSSQNCNDRKLHCTRLGHADSQGSDSFDTTTTITGSLEHNILDKGSFRLMGSGTFFKHHIGGPYSENTPMRLSDVFMTGQKIIDFPLY